MKQIYYITILFSVMLIGFIACEKDKENTMNKESEIYWSEEDVKIQNAILDFQDKIKNNSFKDGEMMSVEDALWNLEALMNYTYSNPVNNNKELFKDNSLLIPVNIQNGKISTSELGNIISLLEAKTEAIYNQVPNDDKALLGVDVVFVENELKNDGGNINMYVYVGYDLVDDPIHYPPFGEDDYWVFGGGDYNNGGYCARPNVGTSLDSDAAEEIEKKINNPVVQDDDPEINSYIVQIVTLNIFPYDYPNNDDEIPDDSMFESLLFYSHNNPITPGDDGYHTCLNPVEMNFHLQGALDIIDAELEKIQMNNPNKRWEFVSVDMAYDYILDVNPSTLIHTAAVSFGQVGVKVPPTD